MADFSDLDNEPQVCIAKLNCANLKDSTLFNHGDYDFFWNSIVDDGELAEFKQDGNYYESVSINKNLANGKYYGLTSVRYIFKPLIQITSEEDIRKIIIGGFEDLNTK